MTFEAEAEPLGKHHSLGVFELVIGIPQTGVKLTLHIQRVCVGGSIGVCLLGGFRFVTLHPMTIMQNSLNGTFGQSGDIANVPPKAATIGPLDVMRAKERIEVHALATCGTFSSWQRMISRLCTHGPITPYLPSTMLQTKKTRVYISDELAALFECREKVGY